MWYLGNGYVVIDWFVDVGWACIEYYCLGDGVFDFQVLQYVFVIDVCVFYKIGVEDVFDKLGWLFVCVDLVIFLNYIVCVFGVGQDVDVCEIEVDVGGLFGVLYFSVLY